MNTAPPVITIDGPSGSGKGTISQMIANALGFHFLDSGALYRLVALASLQQNIDVDAESAVTPVAVALSASFVTAGKNIEILLAGQDVTEAIRTEAVGMVASKIAAYPSVRNALLERQRVFAMPPGLVADGRDMGTTVFPHAWKKIFLTASAEARAERRYLQLKAKGLAADYDQIVGDIRERDERDSKRSISPLVPADDAVIIDSTGLSISEVFAAVMTVLKTE